MYILHSIRLHSNTATKIYGSGIVGRWRISHTLIIGLTFQLAVYTDFLAQSALLAEDHFYYDISRLDTARHLQLFPTKFLQ